MGMIVCKDCDGSGERIPDGYDGRVRCPSCGGDGMRFSETTEEAGD
jgi:DnaJ-class molecular chaperone